MKSAVENLEPTRVKLTVEVSYDELKPSLDHAYSHIAEQVNVPGFRKGKVPPRVLEQRVGRAAVIEHAVNDAVPGFYNQAVAETEVRPMGQPSINVTEIPAVTGTPGGQLVFEAEVDVRPEISLPALDGIEITVEPAAVSEDDVAAKLDELRERFGTLVGVDRPAEDGDFVVIDLSAKVGEEEVDSVSGVSYQIGAGNMLDGLDEALTGLTAGETTTFTAPLAGGEHAGEDAEVTVTPTAVKERDLPEADDDFAQLASEFDTLEELRNDLRERLTKVKKVEQIYAARDEALKQLVEVAEIPAPEGIVKDEVEGRKQAMTDQLERIGASMEDYLASEDKTEEQIDTELTDAATEGVRIQLLLDTIADAEDVQVSDDEFGHEIVHRAQRAQMQPQQYYDQLVQSGAAAAVFGDVRRGKALALVMEQVTMKDETGNTLSLDDLREAGEDEHAGHNH